MLKTRIIPCLLLQNRRLVKTIKFKKIIYVGDPINTVKIFNTKEVDELIFLDIGVSKKNEKPNFALIRNIATECFMPFCYGGGIRTIDDIKKIFSLGAEKVSINSYILENPHFIKQASEVFGSQSIVASIDVKKTLWGHYKVYDNRKRKIKDRSPVDFAVEMEKMGAGEIFLNSVDRDGKMESYDIGLIKEVSTSVNIPVIACGGAGKLADFVDAIKVGHASAVAAGSFFIFNKKYRAVLITYPNYGDLEKLLDSEA